MARSNYKLVAENRRARYEYALTETLEAGLVLTGTEVKSLRLGRCSIAESHCAEKEGELWLLNATIQEYPMARLFNHEPKRPRKLLLHKGELRKLIGAITRKGMTLIPLKLYFNEKGRAKLELALAEGRKKADKRQVEKERDWKREKEHLLKGNR